MANALGKPLFSITSGDLGLTPSQADASLANIFRLANHWDCVLLFDEVDAFVSIRSELDANRSALLSGGCPTVHTPIVFLIMAILMLNSVFLRALEYYYGLLIMTTNRIGDLDEAFRSRIQTILYFPTLSRSQTISIWQTNLDRLRKIDKVRAEYTGQQEMMIHGSDILYFAARIYDDQKLKGSIWSGRSITQALQTAEASARYEYERRVKTSRNISSDCCLELGVRHLEETVQLSKEYTEYMAQATGKSDLCHAQEMGIRDDEFEPIVPVPPPGRFNIKRGNGEYGYNFENSNPRNMGTPSSANRPPILGAGFLYPPTHELGGITGGQTGSPPNLLHSSSPRYSYSTPLGEHPWQVGTITTQAHRPVNMSGGYSAAGSVYGTDGGMNVSTVSGLPNTGRQITANSLGRSVYDRSFLDVNAALKKHAEFVEISSHQDEHGIIDNTISRDTLSRIIRLIVARSLGEAKRGSSDWIKELSELDHGEDEAGFVTRLISNHIFERPWILNDKFVRCLESEPKKLAAQLRCSFSVSSQEYLAALHSKDLSELHECSAVSTRTRDEENAWTISNKGQEIEDPESTVDTLDGLLGLAGFVPALEKRNDWNETASNRFEHRDDRFLRQLRESIKVERDFAGNFKARICLSRTPSYLSQPNPSDVVLQISDMVIRLKEVLESDFISGKGQLHFLQIENDDVGMTQDPVIKFSTLAIGDIRNFLDNFQGDAIRGFLDEQLVEFHEAGVSAWSSGYNSTQGGSFSERVAGTLLPTLQSMNQCMEGIFHMPSIRDTDGRWSVVLSILHKAALTVQSVALILQANARSMVAPFEFSFLEAPVSSFVLEGAFPERIDAAIHASSQELTCLGSMLQQPVLVFHTKPKVGRALDLEATLAELVSMWGPAEISYSSREKPTGTAYGVEFVEIGGGILAPSPEKTTDAALPPLWHWQPGSQAGNYRQKMLRPSTSADDKTATTIVGLHTKIRVGRP